MQKQSFQILTDRLLDRLLETPRKQLRTKSDSTPCAQTTTLRSKDSQPDYHTQVSQNALMKLKAHSVDLYFLYIFMYATATRISEALNIRVSHVLTSGNVHIKAVKGSSDRIVNAGLATEYLLSCKAKGFLVWNEWNRHFVYNRFKYFGISITPKNSTKKAVTHAARHISLNELQNSENNLELTKSFAGHKNINSTKHYVTNKETNNKKSKRD